jgi:hypothetical protein
MLIATFRPADVIVHDHPLRRVKHDLRAMRQCEELALAPLSPADVRAYVDARFSVAPRDQMRRLAARVHERTDGNALFMVDMVNELVAQETLVWRDGRWRVQESIAQATSRTPLGLRELIGRRLQRLTPAMRAVLEVASVVGDEFAVAPWRRRSKAARERRGPFEKLAAQGMLIGDAGVAESSDGRSQDVTASTRSTGTSSTKASGPREGCGSTARSGCARRKRPAESSPAARRSWRCTSSAGATTSARSRITSSRARRRSSATPRTRRPATSGPRWRRSRSSRRWPIGRSASSPSCSRVRRCS